MEEVGGLVGQNINMMDPEGYVIASTDETSIGTLHEGARKIIEEHLDELYVGLGTPRPRPGWAEPAHVPGWEYCGRNRITGR